MEKAEFSIKFKERLKELRISKGLSQSALARVLGIDHRNIGRYEEGTQEPTLTVIVLLAAFFGVSTDYLIGYEKNRINSKFD